MKQRIERIKDELSQAWTVAVKDVRVYYLRPGMIMFGFLMPFFMFFSFSVRRELGAAEGVARLLAKTVWGLRTRVVAKMTSHLLRRILLTDFGINVQTFQTVI